MHECQEIRSANINQKEDRFLIYERDLLYSSGKNCSATPRAYKYELNELMQSTPNQLIIQNDSVNRQPNHHFPPLPELKKYDHVNFHKYLITLRSLHQSDVVQPQTVVHI